MASCMTRGTASKRDALNALPDYTLMSPDRWMVWKVNKNRTMLRWDPQNDCEWHSHLNDVDSSTAYSPIQPMRPKAEPRINHQKF